MLAELQVPAFELRHAPPAPGLIAQGDYLALTRRLLNTIRVHGPGFLSSCDAALWRMWIALLETTDIRWIRPPVNPAEVVFQVWLATHHTLLEAVPRLAVPLDAERSPTGLTRLIPDRDRWRLGELALNVWAWFAQRSVEYGCPFVTAEPPAPWRVDQSARGAVHCVRTACFAEAKSLRADEKNSLPLPGNMAEELWHLQQATGWDVRRLASHVRLPAPRVAIALWGQDLVHRQPDRTAA